MNKSILFEVTRSLTEKEVRELRKWLMSPAHNHRQDAVDLFEFLVKQDTIPEKTSAWKAIFPKEPYDDAFMRQVMYFLNKAIEDYFIFKTYTSEPIQPMLSLAELFRKRHLDKPFRQTIGTARRKLQELPFRNSEYHLDKFYLEQEQYFYYAESNWTGEVNLQEVSDELDMAFVANKLRLACRMISHQSVNKKARYNIGLLEALLTFAEQAQMLTEVGVAVYYYGFKAMTDRSNTEHFENLSRLIRENGQAFPNAEQKELYLLAINICISHINTGNESFFSRAFELYKTGFGKNILVEEGGLVSRFMFTNTVYSAIKTQNYSWAEQFILDFQMKLEEKHRNSIVQFNLSRLYYEKGDFDKAQTLLRGFEYDDMLMNIVAKTMLLKIYYKFGEYDALESLVEAMRSYLQRKETLGQNHKVVFKNILMLMKKLLHLNPYSKVQVEKFRKAVLETNPIQEQEREWFLQQVKG